jgi:hypothetical protein
MIFILKYFSYNSYQFNIHVNDTWKLQSVWDKLGYTLFVRNSKSQNETDAHHDVGNEWKFATFSPL